MPILRNYQKYAKRKFPFGICDYYETLTFSIRIILSIDIQDIQFRFVRRCWKMERSHDWNIVEFLCIE